MPDMTLQTFTRRNGRLSAGLARLEDGLHMIGCISLLVIAALIVFDAVKRVVFGTHLQVQFELTELYLMPAVASLSLSRVFRDRAHLALEIFSPGQFGRLWPVVSGLILVLSIVFFVSLTWQAGGYAIAAFVAGDTYIGVYDWPMGLAYLSVPLGCGVICIRLVHDLIFNAHNL
jgi:TRAP-type C4-dicarboxylate transport system permease small subunit